ncbi:MAG: gamma-glutamyl-gamma-aminobutyrate hydrolase family protein, partial [Verrucomicrobiota bacterium]
SDSYVSVVEALKHAGNELGIKIKIKWIDTESENIHELVTNIHGLVVPQGWGSRGVEGKIKAVQFARENKIPYLGLCFGMQMAVIEFARNVCGIKEACSREFRTDGGEALIHLMEEQKAVSKKGGTMRLGAYPCTVSKGTLAHAAYNETEISERHRHRYEFNNAFRDVLTGNGLILSGVYREKDLVEIVEIADHPWFLACQFHPEFKSKPLVPHPLFKAFIGSSLVQRGTR